ncbi:MAG: ABC transporter substrate-binding protein [Sphingobium sp.]
MQQDAGRHGIGRGLALTLLLLVTGCTASGSDGGGRADSGSAIPQRIVSMNPCVDAILKEIADPEQVAGISSYSQDPFSSSVPMTWAAQFPAVGNEAEDVIVRKPDLVIAGSMVAPQTVSALERLNIPLLQLAVPASVAESKAQIAGLATAIGQNRRGQALNHAIDRAIMKSIAFSGRGKPSALIWHDSGLVPGTHTLANELLEKAGFESASEALGIAQWDMLSLEELVWTQPDVVMTGQAGLARVAGSGEARMKQHPLLRHKGIPIMIADFPSKLLHCGGPIIIPTMQRFTQIHAQWSREHSL